MNVEPANQQWWGRRRTTEGRERVLAVSRELFREYGYAGVSMSQIAHQARMTKAALYYHFEDKEDLFAILFQGELDQVRAALQQAIDPGGTTRDILERVTRLILSANTHDLSRMFHDAAQYLSLERQQALSIEHPIDVLLPTIERAIAAGELRPLDPWIILRTFHAIVVGIAHFGVGVPQIDLPDDQLATLLVDIFVRGVAA
jgi:AcrR family transcriptional regulator